MFKTILFIIPLVFSERSSLSLSLFMTINVPEFEGKVEKNLNQPQFDAILFSITELRERERRKKWFVDIEMKHAQSSRWERSLRSFFMYEASKPETEKE